MLYFPGLLRFNVDAADIPAIPPPMIKISVATSWFSCANPKIMHVKSTRVIGAFLQRPVAMFAISQNLVKSSKRTNPRFKFFDRAVCSGVAVEDHTSS